MKDIEPYSQACIQHVLPLAGSTSIVHPGGRDEPVAAHLGKIEASFSLASHVRVSFTVLLSNMQRISFSSLFVLFLLFTLSEALTGSLLFGSAATGFLYITGFALGPIGFGTVFLGSTLGAQYLGTQLDKEAAQRRLSETAFDRLFWTNCSRPATFTTHHICKSKRHCEDVIRIQGSHDCNACGANALVARRWINPLDTSDYSTEAVCMNAYSRQIFSTPVHSTPPGFWNCSTLPHFHECRRCGYNTAFARYDSHITAAGLQLICVRTDATVEQKFV